MNHRLGLLLVFLIAAGVVIVGTLAQAFAAQVGTRLFLLF